MTNFHNCAKYFPNHSEHMAYAHEMRSELPTAVDLQQASHSIELLITYYELNPNELANGKLLGYSQPEFVSSSFSSG